MVEQFSQNCIRPHMEDVDVMAGAFLRQSGRWKAVGSTKETFHTGSEIRLFFVVDGWGRWQVDQKAWRVKQNDVFFLPPNSQGLLEVDAFGELNLMWADLTGPGAGAFFQRAKVSRHQAVITGIANPRLAQEFRFLVHDSGNMTPADYLHLTGSLYQVLSIILEAVSSFRWQVVRPDGEGVLYTGQWKKWPSEQQTEEVYTAQAKAYVEFPFEGTGIKWYGTMNFDCGKADVILDGRYQATVDAYSPERLPHQLLYVNTKLTGGAHIIKIFCTGEKNSRATNCDVVLDSFHFYRQNRAQEAEEEKLAQSGPLIQQAVRLMKEKAFRQETSVASLAQELGVSRSYLSSCFRAQMGMPPAKYLTRVRMERARVLLETTQKSVSQVASEAGFGDVFYFSRAFKKAEGLSPTQFRQQQRAKDVLESS